MRLSHKHNAPISSGVILALLSWLSLGAFASQAIAEPATPKDTTTTLASTPASNTSTLATTTDSQPSVSETLKDIRDLSQGRPTEASTSSLPVPNSDPGKVDSDALPKTPTSQTIDQIRDLNPATKKAQVTSVSQLSDVRPTDWAFTALQSLVERYGCIAGYPDRTFRGQRAMTRYEFAAGLNACLDKINEIISAGLADKVSKEDLAALQKLQEEFAAELATLRGRVDALEAKTAKLEAQQFSTTTKLYGQAIFGVQARTSNTADLSPRGDGLKDSVDPATNLTFGYNVQLSLATQFDPRSLLLTGLQMGNLSSSIGTFGGTTGSAFLSNTFTRLGYELDTGGAVQLSDLSYRHLIADNFAIIVGPVGVNPVTVFRGPNRYENAGQGAISAFAQRNPILNLGNTTAGLGFDWQIAPRVSLQAVYSAGDVANPTGSGGLFGGPTTIGAQLSLTPAETVDVALYYLNSYVTSPSLNTGVGDNLIGPIGSRYNTNAFGASVNWQISPKVTFGLWGGYTSSNLVGSSIAIPGLQGTVETTNWMAYFNFPNLFNDGDLLGIYVGQPPKITSSNINVSGFPAFNVPSAIGLPGVASGDVGGQPASTTHLEAFYRFRVTKNISITPGILVLFNPVHTSTSDTITIGTLRTTFTF